MPVRDLLSAASTQGAAPSDPDFDYVTLLLNGDGTNGAQNNTFLDSSTNNFTITRNGNTTQGSFSPYGTLWSNYFDGSSYLTAPNNTAFDLSTSDFTIEGFFYPTVGAAFQSILAYASNAGELISDYAFQLLLNSTNGINFRVVASGSSSFTTISTSNTFTLNSWNYVCVTRIGTSVSVYLNGTTTTGTIASTIRNNAGSILTIGRDPDGTLTTTGYLSNLRILKGTAVTPSIPTTPLTAISGTSLLTCQSNRFVDNSSNNATITTGGTPSVQRFSPFNPTAPYSTSVIGGSGYFDGSGDYLTVPYSANTQLGSSDFTIEMWYYPPSAQGSSDVIANGYSSGTNLNWLFQVDVSAVKFYASTTGNSWAVSALTVGTIIPNAWNHIAVTRSGTTVTPYFNGVAGSTATLSGSVYANTSAIAIAADNSAPASYIVQGYISDFRMVIGSAIAPPSGGPTAPLTAVTNTRLLLGMTNAGIPDLAMQNNLETVGNAQVSTSVKKYGTGSLAFDGTGDYLSASNVAFAFGATADYTVEGWAYRSASTDDVGIVATRGATVGFSVFFYGGVLYFQQSYDSGTADNVTETMPPINQWFHFAAVRNSGVLRLYINGVSTNTATSTKDLVSTSLVIGKELNNYDTYYWPGYIDDLRITKGLARYTADFTPPASALPTY